MRALRTPDKKRYLVLVAVAGAHALVVGVLFDESRWINQSAPTITAITAVVLTRAPRLRVPIERPRLNMASVQPVTAAITFAPPVLPATGSIGSTIDWEAQVKRAVTRTLERSTHISFGFPAGGQSAITLGVPSPSSPHYAGEQYRAEGGEQIYWLNDHCYMASDPPSLFEPDFLKSARLARVGCN